MTKRGAVAKTITGAVFLHESKLKFCCFMVYELETLFYWKEEVYAVHTHFLTCRMCFTPPRGVGSVMIAIIHVLR